MSWQGYVDSSLLGSGHIDKACIASIAGDSVWAKSPDFTVTPDELKTIVSIIDEPNKEQGEPVIKAYSDGVHVAGERFVATRIEDRHLYARKGRTGICIVKTKQALLIAHYGENVQAGNATQTVEALADYLIGVDY